MPVPARSLRHAGTVSLGVHEDHVTPDQTIVTFPAARFGRVFVPPKPGERPKDIPGRIQRHTEKWLKYGAYVSYKPSPHASAAGELAGPHREIGTWLAGHPQVGIIVHHEPEGGPDGLDGETFKELFNRSRAEIKEGWAGARVAYCAMAFQWRPNSQTTKHPGPWQGVIADEYLCDVYSGRTTAAAPSTPT